MTKTRKPKFNLGAFAEIERDPVSKDEFSRVFGKVLAHPTKPKNKSKNQEPTRTELAIHFHLKRDKR